MVTDNKTGSDSWVEFQAAKGKKGGQDPQADDQDTASEDPMGPDSDQPLPEGEVEVSADEPAAPDGSDVAAPGHTEDPTESELLPEGPAAAEPGGGDAKPADGAADEVGVEEGDHVEFIEPQPKSKKDKKKAVQKGRRSHERRKPSDKEVLSRLMEKNEVILQLSRKNVQLEATRKALEDKRVRALAEFENYRKRTRKEWELLKEQTKAEVILEILNVVDDFERAFAVVGDRDDEFVQGIRLIYNNMLATLAKFGVTKMIAVGEQFDPNYHMAVAQIDNKEVESNQIVEVIQEGYLMDGTVIRPANVVIAK